MYIKIINSYNKPSSKFSNFGSCSRTVNYLKGEAKEKNQECSFFNSENDNISPDEVKEQIDSNTKGIVKEDEKFFSLAISPSAEELEAIGKDKEKLKEYVKDVMKIYAENFNIKGKQLNQDNLLYFATLHEERKYKGTDYKVKNKEEKAGNKKSGDNTHIHVIVSARDKQMKITLNPLKSRRRFSIDSFSEKSSIQFAEKFNHRKTLYDYYSYCNYKINSNIENKLYYLNEKYAINLDSKYYTKNLKDIDNKRKFFNNLITLNKELKSGKTFVQCSNINKNLEFKVMIIREGQRIEQPTLDSTLNDINNKISSSALNFFQKMEFDPTLTNSIVPKKKKKKIDRGLSM